MNGLQEKKFNEDIQARLRSDEWDLKIAGNVLARRRRRRYVTGAVGSAVSMALAASLIFGILPAFQNGNSEGEAMNRFVNAQVDGIWSQVAAGGGEQGAAGPVLADAGYDDSTDVMIDRTLERRL